MINGRDKEILLAVENPKYVDLTLRVLRRCDLDYKIFVAKDGAEALDYIFTMGSNTHPGAVTYPKLVLLDLKLPKVDGLEVLRQIKSNEQTKAIPVVMFTSSQEKRDIVESYELGVSSYVIRPADFGGFARAVEDLCRYWVLRNQLPY